MTQNKSKIAISKKGKKMKRIRTFVLILVIMLSTFIGFNIIKVKADEVIDETTEETTTEEVVEEEQGFFEKNWGVLLSSLLGTTSGLSLLIVFLIKVAKKVKGLVDDTSSNAKANGKNTEALDLISKELANAQTALQQAYLEIEKLTTYIQENNDKFKEDTKQSIQNLKHEIVTDYGDKVIMMEQAYTNIMEILKLISENSDDIVRNGASRLINELIEESKKEVVSNGEQES